jgi:hypothetical protein
VLVAGIMSTTSTRWEWFVSVLLRCAVVILSLLGVRLATACWVVQSNQVGGAIWRIGMELSILQPGTPSN